MEKKIKIKNIGEYPIDIGINLQKVYIRPGEETPVDKGVWEIISTSQFKDSAVVVGEEEHPREHMSSENYSELPIEKQAVNFRMPLQPIHYDGYGRLARIFLSHFDFTNHSDVLVLIGHPKKYDRQYNDRKVILFTMFEADKIPPRWVEFANQVDGLIVPTEWVKEVFEKSGVTAPIKIVNLGTDTFDLIDPPYGGDNVFTFLHQNSFIRGDQKGWKLTLRAFINVFGNDPKVRLILKGRNHGEANDMVGLPQQENIQYIVEDMTRADLNNFMKQVHCFVFPSRGEGFGLPPIEMMARGVPTILTNAHSMKTFAKYGIPIGITTEQVPSYYVGRIWDSGVGNWVTPDIKQLEKAMKDVCENYYKYKRKAVENQAIIKEKFSVDKMLTDFVKAVDELANGE